jgi:hypothetical protein
LSERGARRDEQGRFAPRPVVRRDELGRFAPAGRPKKSRSRVKPEPARRAQPKKKPEPARRAPAKKKPEPARGAPSRKKAGRHGKPEPRKRKAGRRGKPEPRKKRRRRRRPERPLVAGASREAEREIQVRLSALLDSLRVLEGGLDMAVQSFINTDGSVDGELRVGSLPDEWRTPAGVPLLVATLSNAIRSVAVFDSRPSMGGAFWASFGVRFGPQNESEVGELVDLYKRHRGMFQIGTYPTPAWGMGALQVAITGDTVGLRAMVASLLNKRGLPPSQILIRFVWTPDGKRPAHYAGEK